MHAILYLLKQQIDHVILDGMVGHVQSGYWNLYISKTVGVANLIMAGIISVVTCFGLRQLIRILRPLDIF